jgi:hypothetical protein
VERLRHAYRLWEPPVRHELHELTGQFVDMQSAFACLSRLNALAQEQTKDGELIEAIFISALVRYCRCFTSGNRRKLHIEDLETATLEEIGVHQHIRGTRDWHIAHPVNRQETHAVHLITSTSIDGKPILLGVSAFTSAVWALNPKEISLALSLTEKWLLLLKNRLLAEQSRLRPYAQALLPQQLASLPEADPEPNRDVRARRKQASSQ